MTTGEGRSAHGKATSAVVVLLLCLSLGLLFLLAPSTTWAACPNEEFRTGPSAHLPDCRAYELVTPRDSGGRRFSDPRISAEGNFDAFPTELVSPSAGTLLFSTSASAFATPDGGGGRAGGDSWVVERRSSGWEVVRLMVPSAEKAMTLFLGGVSADHRYSLVFAPRRLIGLLENGPLTQEGDGDYLVEPNGNVELTGVGSLAVERLVQGRYVSPGGDHVIFSTGEYSPEESGWCNEIVVIQHIPCPVNQLEPDAPPAGTGAIYDRPADGPTHVVSLLPGDLTPAAGENAFYQGTAADGSSIAFKIGGTLYVRADNGTPDARTLQVAAGPVTFGGISADGTYLFYVVGGDIHRLNTETGVDEAINSSADGEMVNVPSDGSKVYFVSRSQLDGAKGTAGEPNLYVWSGSTPAYIATVAEADIDVGGSGRGLTSWTSQAVRPATPQENVGPGRTTSQTTPDGRVIVFESRAKLSPPYDNAGHIEIYRYETSDAELDCVSCNPSGAPATVDTVLQSLDPTSVIHNVTDDGARVFFETQEALVDDDIDSLNDVYEWQETDSGAVVALISSGSSTMFSGPESDSIYLRPNVLMGVSPDGRDVFFRSVDPDPLVQGAPRGGAPAIYDARVGGGFPTPAFPSCFEGESCRPHSAQTPTLEPPATAPIGRSDNVKPRQRCSQRRGKRGEHRARAGRCSRKKGKSAR